MTIQHKKLLSFIRSELFPPTPPVLQQPATSPDPDYPSTTDSDPDSAASFAARRREKVYTFVTIPKELEKLMGYGFFQCADAFLYVFTFLPLRCFVALLNYGALLLDSANRRPGLKPSDKCELLKVLILIVCSWLFTYIDTNVLYHVIKSQSVIKLYIFFNMLEVGDRLFGCFSQDTLDALFITATESSPPPASTPTPPSPEKSSIPEPPRDIPARNTAATKTKAIKKLSTTTHAAICTLSILGHALVILLQSTTLSVAINANNRALLTVMMSNNFVELKGSVFKKFDKMNLFQVSCSDIRERFHLFILLLLVCLQTLREYSWEESRFWVLLPDCLMVLLAEIVVDWLKHAFITRFNELPLHVYQQYTRSLAYDMAESVKKKSNRFSSDHSDVVGRRLGFVPLPLAIVLIRVVSPMWRFNSERLAGIVILSVFGYIGLASFRVLNMVVLVGKAVRIIDEHAARVVPEASIEKEVGSSGGSSPAKNSILKRTRTISGSDGDLYLAMLKQENKDRKLKFKDELEEKSEACKCGGRGTDSMLLSKIHLMANSNVSLVSVGFNEEMMKVEEEKKLGVGIGERKHSLGSNLDEAILLMRGVGVKEEEMEEEQDVSTDDELNRTVFKVEVVEEEQLEESGGVIEKSEAELLGEKQQQQHEVDEVKSEETDEKSTSSKKKKLINWFK